MPSPSTLAAACALVGATVLVRRRAQAAAAAREAAQAAIGAAKRRASLGGACAQPPPDPYRNAEPIEGFAVPSVHLLRVPDLRALLPEHDAHHPNPYRHTSWHDDADCVIADLLIKTTAPPDRVRAYVRAGARKELYFRPAEVRAAIVSCGGLCPGINNIIRELYLFLTHTYGVPPENVLGVPSGYRGFDMEPVALPEQAMQRIHHQGGTFLGTSRGGFCLESILRFVKQHRVNQLYIIGGDGTHSAAQVVVRAATEQRLRLSVVCLPKTIDNDLSTHMDRTFGVTTAMQEAQTALRSAKVEAASNFRGIGVVKLMGRHSGSLAIHAALCSGDADLVVLPEVDVELHGPRGVLPHLERTMARKGHAVVVVAEGAGEELLGQNAEVDAGGNRKLPDIIPFLVGKIKQHFEESAGGPAAIKVIDPSYTVRSCPAVAGDAMMCLMLSQNAVHAAMRGFTGLTVGLANNRNIYLPLKEIGGTKVCVNPHGRTYERLLAITGQPEPL